MQPDLQKGVCLYLGLLGRVVQATQPEHNPIHLLTRQEIEKMPNLDINKKQKESMNFE